MERHEEEEEEDVSVKLEEEEDVTLKLDDKEDVSVEIEKEEEEDEVRAASFDLRCKAEPRLLAHRSSAWCEISPMSSPFFTC
ncbi:unnamed protein product [Arctogadus glacialis]